MGFSGSLKVTIAGHKTPQGKRILRRYGYPSDKQERATQTVLEQAELLSAEWAIAG